MKLAKLLSNLLFWAVLLACFAMMTWTGCGDGNDGSIVEWWFQPDPCCVCLARAEGCIDRTEDQCDQGGQFRTNCGCIKACGDDCADLGARVCE